MHIVLVDIEMDKIHQADIVLAQWIGFREPLGINRNIEMK